MIKTYATYDVESVEVVINCIDHFESMYFENVVSAELNTEEHYLFVTLAGDFIRYFNLENVVKINIERRLSR